MKAKTIWYYYMVYAGYIEANNLPDDTAKITTQDLKSFVEEYIDDPEDRDWYVRLFQSGM